MLERLGQHHASLEDIQVANSLAEQKPESERQILPEGYSLPIQLDRIADKEALRLAIGRASGAFGKLPGAKAGTYSKRLRLRVSCSSLERRTAGEVEIELQGKAVWIGKPTADPDELNDEVRRAISRARKHPWSAPVEWSSLIVSGWSAFGLSERCFRALVGGIPERCAV